MQRRNGHGLATIKTDEGGMDQLADIHHLRQRIDVDAGTLPYLGARGRGQHGLHVDTLR
ncbi:hypothetical protein D3C81_2035950 [compost metagenome]